MVDKTIPGRQSRMTDIDALLERLRIAAVDHAPAQAPGPISVRSWPPAVDAGARRALLEAWAPACTSGLKHYLVQEPEDFIELAFLSCLGRSADPVGRGHYLGRLQQRVPRLEVLAQLAGSPESVKYRGKPRWPLWFHPLLWGLRLPSTLARRGTREALRRIEGRLARRALRSAQGLIWRLARTMDERDRFLSQDLLCVTERLSLAESRLSATQSLTDDMSARLAGLGAGFDASSKALTAMRAQMAALDYGSSRSPGLPGASAATGAAPVSDDDVIRYYLTLESVFRGDPARIRAQLEADYLELLVNARGEAGDGPCVDLGCGRGEWLDIVRDHGFAARGVDLNPAMAMAAIASGHEVIVGDALAFLRRLPGDSVLAISAFHLAEHLDFPTLFRVVAECRRVLKPRGLLILETPNPENIWVATHTFHHDPTHGNPLTPTSLEFLVNHHGLETVAVLRLHPYPAEARLPGNDPVSERLNAMTCGGQDFAVVAKKTPVA